MASSVMETLTCIDYDEVFHQLEERGRNALAMDMAVMAFRQKGRVKTLVVGDLQKLGISEQIINAAKDLVAKEKAAENQKQGHKHSEPDR
jgi:hypothetical protein